MKNLGFYIGQREIGLLWSEVGILHRYVTSGNFMNRHCLQWLVS